MYDSNNICSGLAIVSKFPLKRTQFKPFKVCGNPWHAFFDGECLAGKGVGQITINPLPRYKIFLVLFVYEHLRNLTFNEEIESYMLKL